MIAPASVGWRGSVARVKACAECHEALNARWFYPPNVFLPGHGMAPNPFQGQCRNCGSMKFVVGEMSLIDMEWWERNEGWEFMPWRDPTDLETGNPLVKNNIHVIQRKDTA